MRRFSPARLMPAPASPNPTVTTDALTKSDFEALSEFRYRLRRFLNFSESAARDEGITPQQYLLLLHVKGIPGRDWASISELAERLQAVHHSVVALVARCEKAGLVTRRQNESDRRVVEVHLSAAGDACLMNLAAQHRNELSTFADIFHIRGVHL
ncbi:putative HTH-type transcriptional regulator YusO [Pandoraea cepalis]|uniref:Putative HTH-type transcriptional regulator YusO n=2 Tax=Burkholderiaceae TaxID=119060 RepID=A0A5E4UPT1_9BURK|nr:MarR family transcriptional regulator [Pandoraea sp. NE5]VVE01029.1 putative HTH-type transcriptional regulator YusO [Pandoraea cepalis]